MSKANAKPIGMTSLVCLVIANMIGTGVYTTSGYAVGALGSRQMVMLVWFLGAAIALFGAVCYGALARQLARSGGEYLFLSRGVHPLVGFMAGWISLLAGFTGAISVAASGFAKYLPEALHLGLNDSALAIALIFLCAVPHLLHVGTGAIAQNVLVLIKLLAIATFIVVGLLALTGGTPADPAGPTKPQDFSAFVFANQLMWVSFSFAGFNAAIYIAGEAKIARQTVRKSMLHATLGVSVIYLLLNLVFLYSSPVSEIAFKQDIAAISANHIGGAHMETAVRLLVALSLVTSVSAMVLAGPRVYAKMAQDGLLPRLFEGAEIPRAAILLQVVLASVFVLLSDLKELINFTSFLLSLSAAATVGCLLLPRFAGRPESRPLLGWPWVPLAFVMITLVIAGLSCKYHYEKSPTSFWISLSIMSSGILAFFIFRGVSESRGAADQKPQ